MGSLSSSIPNASGFVGDVLGGTARVFNSFGGIDALAQRNYIRSQQDRALRELQEKQRLREQNALQDAALKKAEITAKAAQDEADRRSALRRAVARQRVRAGASGIGAQSGSGEAILLGLFEESDAERETRETLDNLRVQAIDQNIDQLKQQNLLETTLFKDRQKFERTLL